MWKRVMALMVVLVLVLAVTAEAVMSRGVSVRPLLSFEGTTAKCVVTVVGNTENETIFATIKLMHGDEMIRTWYPSARGILDFEESVGVTRGETYTLTVQVVTNNVMTPWFSVSGECD